MKKNFNLIIIGSGPAGFTAAIYAGRANLAPLVIRGDKPGGQLMTTSLVENWPGIIKVMGPELMKDMQKQAEVCGATMLDDVVVSCDFSKKPFEVSTKNKGTLTADAIIIATGATPRRLGCPGEDMYWGKGISTCAVCDAPFYKGKKILIVGGGDTAMEHVSNLSKYTNDITLVQDKEKLTATWAMQQHVEGKNIPMYFNSSVIKFEGNDRIRSATIKHLETGKEKKLEVDGVFLAIGLDPNTKPFKGQLEIDKYGYIKAEKEIFTSIPGVFVAGDAHDYKYRQAVVAASAGCKAAMEAEWYLVKSKK